jgi:hypothetical protein
LAELKACTLASASPSNGVGQAEFIVGRISEPDADPVEIDAHTTALHERGRKRLLHDQAKVFWPLPTSLVVKSPIYSAAPNGAPACSSRKTV